MKIMGTWRSSYPKVTAARLNCTNARMIIQPTQVYFHLNRSSTEEKPNARSKDKFAMAMFGPDRFHSHFCILYVHSQNEHTLTSPQPKFFLAVAHNESSTAKST